MKAKNLASSLAPATQPVQLDELCEAALGAVREAMCQKDVRLSLSIRDGFTEIEVPEEQLSWALSALLGLAVRLAARGAILRLEAALDRRARSVGFIVRVASTSHDGAHRQLEHLRAQRLLAIVGGSLATRQDHDRLEIEIRAPITSDEEDASARPTETPISHERAVRIEREVLLVEDDDQNIATVGDYLDSLGYDVHVARDGREALDMARRLHPAVILMDVQLPGMDGLAATRALRADVSPDVSQVPIIALTAMAMSGDRARCLAAGADEYLMKPVSLKKLRAVIEERLQIVPVRCGQAQASNDAG